MKAVLFDFGGTLDADGLTWLDRFHPLYKEAGLAADRESFARAFYDSDDALASRHDLRGLSLEETVSLQVDDVLSRLAPQRRASGAAIARRFVEDCRRHLDRNRPMLRRLKERYRLGVVSNFYGNLEGLLRREGLLDLFDVVADSAVVGALKPEPAIFQHALGRLGAAASESLMVGDSVPRDMRGAEGLRMPHALIGPAAGAPCCAAAWRLSTLGGLEALLA